MAAGVSGLLAAGAAIAVGHLVAVVIAPAASPLLAVGATFIDLTPEWLKSFAIRTFGGNDKVALLGGIGAVLAVAAIGDRARRAPPAAARGRGDRGARRDRRPCRAASGRAARSISLVPALVGAAVGDGRPRRPRARSCRTRDDVRRADGRAATGLSRRRFLAAGAATGGLIVASGGLGVLDLRHVGRGGRRAPVGRPSPRPLEPLAAVKAGADLGIDGVAPFITPNDAFYRVDTALQVPAIAPDEWRLRIHGMVDREVTLTLADLLAYPTIERDITLTCVSNEVGGEYAGNARWIGIPLATVLEEAGVQAGADQIVSRSIDGMSIGTPTAVALDGRDAMLAIGDERRAAAGRSTATPSG